MKTLLVSEAKAKLGRIADEALAGKPCLIIRKGKLLQLAAYKAEDTDPPPPGFFAECYQDKSENQEELRRVSKHSYKKAEA